MDLDWLALLFIVFALAIFFSTFAVPQYVFLPFLTVACVILYDMLECFLP